MRYLSKVSMSEKIWSIDSLDLFAILFPSGLRIYNEKLEKTNTI